MAAKRVDQRAGMAPGVLWTGVLIGMGAAAALDEIVMHQLLDWHHFYDLTVVEGAELDARTRQVGLLSDGLFHVLGTGLLVLGMYRLWRLGRPHPGWGRRLWAGLLVGLGGFNLYDGIVQHKVLGIHQVRRDAPDLLPYDIAFIGLASLALLAGVLLLLRAGGRAPGAGG